MAYKYNAFISYNHDDIKIAKYVQKILETGISRSGSIKSNSSNSGRVRNSDNKKDLNTKRKWPKLEIFRDETHLVAGELDEGIRDAIKQSEFLIVICSENAVKSQYVHLELGLFLRNFAEDTPEGWHKALKNVLFVGCDNSLAKNKNVIRTLIKKAFKGDPNEEEVNALINEARESLFANFGSQKDAHIFNKRQKKREEVYMLAGKIMGVDKNQLSRRSERRHRAIAMSVALAAVIVPVLIYISVNGFISTVDRDADRLAMIAETQLEEGDKPLAAELAIKSMERKLFYRKIAPKAISVLADTIGIYENPFDRRIEKSRVYDIGKADFLTMDVSENGQFIATINDAHDLIIWDAEKDEQIMRLSGTLLNMRPNPVFIGDDKILSYSYGGYQCYSLSDGKRVWAEVFDPRLRAIKMNYSDNSAMNFVVGNMDVDGLSNLKVVDINGQKSIICVERQKGLLLRDSNEGNILKQLPGDKIKELLPKGTSPCKDIEYQTSTMISQLQSPDEICYDPELDLVLIPCYSKKVTKGDNPYTVDSVEGFLRWDLTADEAKYVALDDSVQENGANEMKRIIYPGRGVAIIILNDINSQKLSAFDTRSGKLLWRKNVEVNDDVKYAKKNYYATKQGFAMIDGSDIVVVDPLTGKESGRCHLSSTGWTGDTLAMILGDNSDPDIDIGTLDVLTMNGKMYSLKTEKGKLGFDIGGKSESVSEDEIRSMESCMYVPSEKSFTGTGQLFSYKKGTIHQYEIGLKNDTYQEIASTSGSDLNTIWGMDVKLFAIGDQRYLLEDVDKSWYLYDLSGDEPKLLWSVSTADLEHVRYDKYAGPSCEEIFSALKYVGIDPSTGKLVFYQSELHGFVIIDPHTGEISMDVLPDVIDAFKQSSKVTTRIMEPTITESGINFILNITTEDAYSYMLCRFDPATNTSHKTILPDITGELDNLALFSDRTGHLNVVLGLPKGPILIDTDKAGDCIYLNYAEQYDEDRQYMNSFFVSNRPDMICKFSEDGSKIAINYIAINQIVIYDTNYTTKASVDGHWDYFQTIITDMRFNGKFIDCLSNDGRFIRVRLKDMKLQQTARITEYGSRLRFAETIGDSRTVQVADGNSFIKKSMTGESIWVKDGNTTFYCVDLDDMAVKQKINNAGAASFDDNQVIVYLIHGNEVMLGSLPIYKDEEILAKAKAFIGNRKMSEEDKIYYGIN